MMLIDRSPMFRISICFSLIFIFHSLCSQDTSIIKDPPAKESLNALLTKYLSDTSSLEIKIAELIWLSQQGDLRGDLIGALQKIQIALMLEKQIPPSAVTFTLNEFAGRLIQKSNPRYALEFFRKAIKIIPQVPDIPAWQKFSVYSTAAGLYQDLLVPDSAKYYHLLAIQAARFDSRTAEASAINNLGVFFHEESVYDSARIYFQKALIRMGPKENELGLYCSITDNIAQLDTMEHRYADALNTFWFNDSVYSSWKVPYQYIVNKVRLIKTLDKINDPGLPAQISSFNNYIDQFATPNTVKDVLDFYHFAEDYFFRRNNRAQHAFYLDKYIALRDSIEQISLERLNAVSESFLAMQEANLASEINAYQLRAERDKMNLNRARFAAVAATIGALFIIAIFILLIRKRKMEQLAAEKIAEGELQRKELEAKLVRQELELKKHDLTNVVLHNTQVYDANQKMIDRLQGISTKKIEMEEQIRSLLVELQGQNQISGRSIGIQANIDSVNTEFYDKLKARYPNLTKAESELCGYIRINLTSKDISLLKNVAATSVKMGKNRLRKRLGIGAEEDLYSFIRQI